MHSRLFRTLLLTAALPFGAGCSRKQEAPGSDTIGSAGHYSVLDTTVLRTIGAQLGGAQLQTIRRVEDIDSIFGSVHFDYHVPSTDQSGQAIAVFSRSGEVPWLLRFPAWPSIHHLVWRDFNGDSLPDLFFLAGEEEASMTYLYVNRLLRGSAPPLALSLADSSEYLSVFDIDRDGKPELVGLAQLPGMPQAERYVEPDDPKACVDSIPDRHWQRVRDEFVAGVGAFHAANFKFRQEKRSEDEESFDYPVDGVIGPTRIWNIVGDSAKDVTSRFRERLLTRLAILDTLDDRASPECARKYDAVKAYLRRLLKDQVR